MANEGPTGGPRVSIDPRRLPALETESDAAEAAGNCLRALPPRREILSLIQGLYGPENAKSVPHLRRISLYQEKMGFLNDAERSIALSLRINEKTPMESTPEIARDLRRLGELQIRRRAHGDAEAALTRGIKITRIVHGDDHAETAEAWTLWGDLKADTGRFEEAAEGYGKAMFVWGKLTRKDAAGAAETIKRQARLFELRGDGKKVEPTLLEALTHREKTVGPNDPGLAGDLLALGRHHNRHKLFRKSLPLLGRALEIRQAARGPNHPDLAEILLASGDAQGLQGDVMQAEEFFHKALRLLEQNRGAQCPELAGGLNDLAALYYDHSHYKEAEPLLRQAIDILQTVFGPAHPEVSTGLNNLMMCLQSLGRSVETEGLKQQLIERARHLGR